MQLKLNGISDGYRLCSFGGKGKAIPLQAWRGPEGSRMFQISRKSALEGGKVVSPTHRQP
jgi:hypothetical protein